MIAARVPRQRPSDARLLVVRADGSIAQSPRTHWIDHLHAGDLVVANDAATLPASLVGVHVPTNAPIEVRLATRHSLAADDVLHWTAVVFGAGHWRTRTEDRMPPPDLEAGDRLALGPLAATIVRTLDHPRLASLRFAATPATFWRGLAHHGRPIQYAHLADDLAAWDVQTPIAGPPVAVEPPSAGFVIDWQTLRRLRERGVGFATLTHAAGLSSTGDPLLDARLPLDEPYAIPASTARAVERARRAQRRIIAIGTTVVRALEHSARRHGRVVAGADVADNRIAKGMTLNVVDALLTGTHEAGSSHFELLRAFADDGTLARATSMLDAGGFRTHEFGDSMLVVRARVGTNPFIARAAAGFGVAYDCATAVA
jgi:S-adenosylmethionine:tRNA ribosyltransferase-isomerase